MNLATDLVKRLRHDALPPLDRLRQLLDYDPDRGTFHWRVDVGNRQAGDPAGSVLPDRHCITIDGKNYQARRIAWYLLYGEIPQSKLYARNGDMTDHSAANITDDKHQANTLPLPDKPLVSAMPPRRSKKPVKQTTPRVVKPQTAPGQTIAPKTSSIVPKMDRRSIQSQIQTTNATNIARLMANPRLARGELEAALVAKAIDDGDMAAMKLILARTHNERTMGDAKETSTPSVRVNITTLNPGQPNHGKEVGSYIIGESKRIDDEP